MDKKLAAHVMQMAEAETGVSPLHYNQLLESAKVLASAYDRLREALEECRLIVANLPHGEKLLLAKIDAALSPLPQGEG